MKSKVVHCKKEKYDVYIGRGSKWGNPYSHKDNTSAKFKVSSRNEAIEKYKYYITKGEGQHLLKDLEELRGKVLGCWCGNFTIEDKNNKRCHGQILLDLLHTKELF